MNMAKKNFDNIKFEIIVTDTNSPSKDLEIHSYVMSSEKPNVLWIPKGYANGCMTLKSDTKVIYFSTSTLEESKNDDFRYDSDYWNCWNIIEH